jgi:4-azaleucine resistance transporter AzlC
MRCMSQSPDTLDAPALRTRASARARFWRGMELGSPIFLGYVPVGIAFGILARSLGFSTFEAVTCSATALAGAGQFIALAVLGTGAGVATVLTATTIVNMRYVLFAATLSPYLKGVSTPKQAAIAFTLTDETFAVNIAEQQLGLSSSASMIGVGVIAWTGWVLGTFVGALGADWIGDPGRFGVGFAMPAMFTALFIALAEDWRHVLIGILAGTIVLLLPILASAGLPIASSWFLVIASMLAATLGAAVWRDQ